MTDASCLNHPGKTVRWLCATCGVPLCEACGAGALEGHVYCPKCLPSARPTFAIPPQKLEKDVKNGIRLSFLLFFLVTPFIWFLATLLLRLLPLEVYSYWLRLYLVGLVGNPLVVIGVASWMAKQRGRPKLAKGLLIGLAIWIGLVVLLVAACFGGIALFSMRR